ncbi:hypothetical protein V1511DRAFT_397500 [Dipodascopsis uninucleata]
MDPDEEKAQELELLQSMYPDELTIESSSKFSILLKLEAPTTSGGAQIKSSHQCVQVQVEYTEGYPETAAGIDLHWVMQEPEEEDNEDNEDDKDDDVNVTKILEEPISLTNGDLDDLRNKANQEAQDNLGFPSVFAITSSIKDMAETILQDRLTEREMERERKIQQEEEKEQAKFRGTLVNKENFYEWRRKFRAEMAALAERTAVKDPAREEQNKRPTGREIFEKGLEGSKKEDDNEEILSQDLKSVKINS